jgi:hypothetical protein
MNREDIYEAWAPREARWSAWAKPVLFTKLTDAAAPIAPEIPSEVVDVSSITESASGAALVLDLPGTEAVKLGLALTRAGYRPVPLFNNVPGPSALVEVNGILEAIARGAGELLGAKLPPDAPPAFLLDSGRMAWGGKPTPGQFDNRWVVFPQDFPSAGALRERGIERAILIHGWSPRPSEDLAHVLRRWQEAGIAIEAKVLQPPGPAVAIEVPRPSLFRSAFYRILTILKLRRHSAGGFGGVVPLASQG